MDKLCLSRSQFLLVCFVLVLVLASKACGNSSGRAFVTQRIHRVYDAKAIVPKDFVPRTLLRSTFVADQLKTRNGGKSDHMIPRLDPGETIPIKGNIWPVGGFYTQITVGSPPQPQLVQLDTGSSDLLVAQKGCDGCPKTVQYDPAASKTSRPVACDDPAFTCRSCVDMLCHFNNTYQTCDYANPDQSCSLLGPTFRDVMTLGKASAQVGLGGILKLTLPDNEWTNMPGVWGLAYSGIASVWHSTAFESFVLAGELDNIFGVCIGHNNTGFITFGGVDQRLQTSEPVYTPIQREKWYVLYMTDLAVEGKSVGLPAPLYNKIANGTILDSGTNTLVVSEEAYGLLYYHFAQYCKEKSLVGLCSLPLEQSIFGGKCFAMSAEQVEEYPSVSIALDGIPLGKLQLRGIDYLIPHPELQGHYCMGIQSSGEKGFTILGNVFMNPFYITFDREKKRLGFAEASSACQAPAV